MIEIHDEIYDNMLVFIAGDIKQKIEYINTHYNILLDTDTPMYGGVYRHPGQTTWIPYRGFYLVHVEDPNDITTAIHELYHLTTMVMCDSLVENTAEQSEAGAYYMEWVFKRWMKYVRSLDNEIHP